MNSDKSATRLGFVGRYRTCSVSSQNVLLIWLKSNHNPERSGSRQFVEVACASTNQKMSRVASVVQAQSWIWMTRSRLVAIKTSAWGAASWWSDKFQPDSIPTKYLQFYDKKPAQILLAIMKVWFGSVRRPHGSKLPSPGLDPHEPGSVRVGCYHTGLSELAWCLDWASLYGPSRWMSKFINLHKAKISQ